MGWGSIYAVWGMWVLMFVGIGAFWAVVFWTVRALVIRQEASSVRAADPMWALKERLSKGEITVAEYHSIRALIDSLPGHVPLHPQIR